LSGKENLRHSGSSMTRIPDADCQHVAGDPTPEPIKSSGRDGLVDSPGLEPGALAVLVKSGDVVYEV